MSAVAARAGVDLFSRFDLETSGGRIPAMEGLRAYAVLVIQEACYGKGWLNRLFAWRPLRRIGNVSYSLFLVHTTLVFFVVYVLGRGWFTSNGLAAALIGVVVALAASLVLAGMLFLIAERPYFSAQRRKHT